MRAVSGTDAISLSGAESVSGAGMPSRLGVEGISLPEQLV